jgi:LPS-assembly protein
MWLELFMAAMLAAPVEGAAETSEFTLTAERMLHDGANKRTIAEGKAHLETTGAAVDAERILYDQERQRVVAVGAVVARIAQQGTPTAIIAEIAEFQLDGERVTEVHVFEGKAFAKAGANVPKLLAATTKEQLDAAGASTMLMSGNHFVRVGDGWQMDNLELTPCDCDLNTPSWSIRTSTAEINGEADRVFVNWPTIWVKNLPVVEELPVFVLPPLSFPLGDRATGLLFPKPLVTQLSGFQLEQPVFVTVGRSADFTFTPGYFFGGARRNLDLKDQLGIIQRDSSGRPLFSSSWKGGALDPVASPFVEPSGIMGPRLLTEFRYVLSDRAQGRASLGLLYDLREKRDPGNRSLALAQARGLRGEASFFHTQDFGNGFGTRVDLGAYSDGYYQSDVTTDVIAREAGYLRSSASVFQRGAHHLVTLDTVLRQDFTAGYDLFGRDVFPGTSTSPKYGPNTIQRLPALTFVLPVRRLVGPLSFDLTAAAVQQMPLRFGTGDEGRLANEGRSFDPLTGSELPSECVVERLYLTRSPNSRPQCPALMTEVGNALKRGLADSVWQPGERESRLAINLMPRLWVSGLAANAVSVSAAAAWRQGVWLGQSSGRAITRGYPLISGRAELELTRVFEGRLRHSFTPVVEIRAVPFVLATSSLPNDLSLLGGPAPYDEIDRAIGDNRPRVQAVAEFRNRLVERGGREVLRLDVGQGFDLLSPITPGPGGALAPETTELNRFNTPRLAESYARLAFNIWWFRATARARVEPQWRKTLETRPAPRLTSGDVMLNFDTPKGHGLTFSYDNLLDDGTNRSRAPIDLLFGDPIPASAESRAQRLSAGGRLKVGSFQLRGEVTLSNRQWPRLDAMGQSIKDANGMDIQDTLLSFAQYVVGATWTPACDCFRIDGSISQTFIGTGLGPLQVVGFNFSVSRLGSIIGP